MGGRRLAPFLLVAAVLVGACSESANDVSTAPEFAPKPATCNFTSISSLVKDEFGASSTESSLATDMKNAGAETALATSIGYQILASIGNKYDGSQASTSNASALTVALLRCMDIGTASVPDTAVIKVALASSGAYGVRPLVADDTDPVTSHDGDWLLEPPANQTWQSMLPAGTSSILVYGVPVTNGAFTNDEAKSGVFDWTTLPKVTFNDPGIVIGQCKVESQHLQHNPAGPTAEVLGFVTPSCFVDDGLGLREREPRTFAERMFRLFAPAPAYAALLTTTGSGGSKRTLSPFQVIFPRKTVLVPPFQWKKSGYVVNAYFPQIDYQATSFAGTKFLQPYILVWLEATNNQGAKVLMCNNWAYTNAEGKVSFTKAYLNKAGGYTITTRTAGAFTITPQGGQEITIPTVPPSDPQISSLINVKNNTSTPPDLCPSFKLGTDYTINADGTANVIHAPEAPGPNILIAQ